MIVPQWTQDGLPTGSKPTSGSRRAAKRAEFLLRLAETVHPGCGEDAVARACAALAETLGMCRAALYLGRPGDVTPHLIATASGREDAAADAVLREVGGPPALLAAVRDRSGALVANGRCTPLLAGWMGAQRLEVATAVGAPLLVGTEPLGALVLDDPLDRVLRPDDLRLVDATARQLAGWIGREREVADAERRLATAAALRHVLQMGVRACSSLEAAEALAICAANALGVPVASAYLVDESGLIREIATAGASPEEDAAIRRNLIGKPAVGSPVWRRVMEGNHDGADLIADARVSGTVRKGGVAESLGLRFLATIPLLSSDGPIGLILCGDRAPRYEWPEGIRELLHQLALEGTLVVDNARLRESEHHRATHDALTGLMNRHAFSEQLDAAIRRARRYGGTLTVLLADLDRFKEVNDTLGHRQGDALLLEVAGRLRAALRGADVVARLGGDEFTAMLTSASLQGACAAAERVATSLNEPVRLGHVVVGVDVSIGIACYPDHGDDVDTLMQHADIAMYAAKQAAVPYRVFEPSSRRHHPHGLALVADLRQAIAENGLSLHYQPKLRLADGVVAGVEALLRWTHPRLGPLAPHRFVPVAETSGLIRSLTTWVVRHALAQCAAWRDIGLDLPVAVNVSAKDLTNERLGEHLARWLATAGIPAHMLTIELTESAVMADSMAGTRALAALRALGVRVSLDDFGTGYSSLAYLTSIPLDEMKIDRSFLLQGMGDEGAVVVRSVIGLGKQLGLTVVAEGVESPSDYDRLVGYGCDQVQGYALCAPLPPVDLQHWVALRRAGAVEPSVRAGACPPEDAARLGAQRL